MRKFRAIIESLKEPEDHEVIWYRKGELLYWGDEAWEPLIKITEGPEKIPYKNENDESVSTVKEALDKSIDGVADLNDRVDEIADKVYYPKPKVVFFGCDQAGIHKVGEVLNPLRFTWEIEGRVTSLKFNGVDIPVDTTEFIINEDVEEDTTYTLEVGNDSGTVVVSVDVRFVHYVRYGIRSGNTTIFIKQIPLTNSEILLESIGFKGKVVVEIPKEYEISHIWYNGILGALGIDYTLELGVGFRGVPVKEYITRNSISITTGIYIKLT